MLQFADVFNSYAFCDIVELKFYEWKYQLYLSASFDNRKKSVARFSTKNVYTKEGLYGLT